MRKLVLSAMALAMTVAFVGCGETAPPAKPSTPAASAAPAMTDTKKPDAK